MGRVRNKKERNVDYIRKKVSNKAKLALESIDSEGPLQMQLSAQDYDK